ncbi:MAG: TetR/AcrR family transcriptional regulator [Caulobacteraceae bacterium]|nr:TetR/AcrR family transcriptional regulator [Caulobacter sp.]
MTPPATDPTKRTRVVAAAAEVFLRYGFARTTMGDIAAQAGMSRPALYLLFPGKEEVFAQVVRRLNAEQLDAIRARLPALPTLREKLLHACLAWGAHGVEVVAAHPDARDLFDVSRPPVREMYDAFEALVAELVAPALEHSPLPLAPEGVGRGLAYAMRGFKDTAADVDDMRRLIAAEVEVVSAALSAPPTQR